MKTIITTCLLVLTTVLGGGVLAATPGQGDFDYAAVKLRAGVWLDKGADEVYQGGDRMTVGFQVNADAYAVVYRIDTEGYVTILWPRSRLDDGFLFSGHEYQLPVPGAEPLRTGSSEGEGFVEILASQYPFDLRELAIDFHGENRKEPYSYDVAGDPFLAMNDINFAITGLEDTADYVVSDYAPYYVHRKVDHPRYLCSQCHLGDEERYDPYTDHCTLDIQYDYGWSNRWYDTYGYYPVYAQPVYVYIDPWNYRPWVNFWYWPSYSCGPSLGYSWYGDCWAWCDSPYYQGDVYAYGRGGGHRFRPLTPGGGDRVAYKTREFARVTPLIKGLGPDERQRSAMTTRTPVVGARDRDRPATAGGSGLTTVARGSFRGQAPIIRSGPVVTAPTNRDIRPGLRIRAAGTPAAGESGRVRQNYRHVAGSGAEKPALKPVRRAPTTRNPSRVRAPSGVRDAKRPGVPSAETGRTIKPVEPRPRGTRIWNSGSTSSRVREGGRSVKPRRDQRRVAPSRTPRVTPRHNTNRSRKASPRETPRVRDTGGSRNSGAKEPAGGGTTRSSGGKSSTRSSSGGRRR